MKQLIVFSVAAATAFASHTVVAQAPQSPELAARSYLLLDMTANRVLTEYDADKPNDPASLTKLMTAYVVFGALRDKKLTLEQTLPVSKRAWDERKGDPSLMFIDTLMTPKVEELLKGMIVQSGNDASVALAEGVAGSTEQFVAMMNRQVQAWGLKNTEFKNVTGMTEPGHKSSARDLSVIASHLIRDFPEYYSYYSQKDFTFNKIRQENRNLLLRRDPTVDGMKTGYTDAAGYCLVTSAQRDFPNGKRRLLSVVMGTASKEARANESQKLLNWGYTAFDAVKLFEAGQPVLSPVVWKGKTPVLKLGSFQPLVVSVPAGTAAQIKTQVARPDPLVAPFSKGQSVGSLKVLRGDQPLFEVPLVALESVEQAGVLGRAWDALRLWIK